MWSRGGEGGIRTRETCVYSFSRRAPSTTRPPLRRPVYPAHVSRDSRGKSRDRGVHGATSNVTRGVDVLVWGGLPLPLPSREGFWKNMGAAPPYPAESGTSIHLLLMFREARRAAPFVSHPPSREGRGRGRPPHTSTSTPRVTSQGPAQAFRLNSASAGVWGRSPHVSFRTPPARGGAGVGHPTHTPRGH